MRRCALVGKQAPEDEPVQERLGGSSLSIFCKKEAYGAEDAGFGVWRDGRRHRRAGKNNSSGGKVWEMHASHQKNAPRATCGWEPRAGHLELLRLGWAIMSCVHWSWAVQQ